jgi:GR25 family glycosyltransferase involved in LPS biosynthesis
MMWRALGSCVVALLTAGCSIHPLPEDVTGLDTNNIVFHIRCEARDALQHAVTAFLLNPRIPLPDSTRRAAQDLKDGKVKFEDFDLRKLDPWSRSLVVKYENAAIAYDFTFDINEDNAAGANAQFLSVLTHNTFGLAAGVSTDRQRQTISNFRISDTFGGLRKTKLCGPEAIAAHNYIYPIAGAIGLDNIVRTFVDLNEFENLSSTDKDKVAVKADTFNFLTLISGTATPTLTIMPVHAARFNLTQASVPLSASRRDTHKVIVAISLPVKKAEVARARSGVGLLALSPVTTVGGKTLAEQRALIEIDNQKTINSLNNIALQPR